MMIKYRYGWAGRPALLIFLLILSTGCLIADSRSEVQEASGNKGEKTVRMYPEEFLTVDVEVNSMNPCSPPMPTKPGWRGIIIKAPERIYFSEDEANPSSESSVVFPVCGFYLINIDMDAESTPMTLVAENIDTGQMFKGPMIKAEEIPDKSPPEREPLDPEEVKGMASGGYFNTDLMAYTTLPRESAVYNVHIEFSGFTSNAVKVRLVKEKSH